VAAHHSSLLIHHSYNFQRLQTVVSIRWIAGTALETINHIGEQAIIMPYRK